MIHLSIYKYYILLVCYIYHLHMSTQMQRTAVQIIFNVSTLMRYSKHTSLN